MIEIPAEISTSRDDLVALYNNTTTESNLILSDNLSINHDPNNHEITFIDPESNPINNLAKATLDENGRINLPDSLPNELKEELAQAGFKIHETMITSLVEGSATTVESMVTGHKTIIPEGSEWVSDGSKWDLVLKSDSTNILINDARFSDDGNYSIF